MTRPIKPRSSATVRSGSWIKGSVIEQTLPVNLHLPGASLSCPVLEDDPRLLHHPDHLLGDDAVGQRLEQAAA